MCALLLPALMVGCSGGSQVAPVTGLVTLDGRPLENADVTFQPDASRRPSMGRTDAKGHYELAYKRGQPGALVGEHTVRIYVSSELVPNPPHIPARYDTHSTLRRRVEAGKKNVFDFALTSNEE
ncbi:MAG TPA: carboxypeptidase-like regulatory domain-containing protein [Lacipirellulaceae bacterium]|nr:carboxypeptidase-like regulatory domain-containing protein [Lacipirellulaceae bacterium]